MFVPEVCSVYVSVQVEEVRCTLECELLDVSQRYCGMTENLTFPGLPPNILITLQLIRSISGRCTRVAAMMRDVVTAVELDSEVRWL